MERFKHTMLLFVTDYEEAGSAGRVKGKERLVGEVALEAKIHENFLLYRPFDINGVEVNAGINLSDIHSFRTETIKEQE